MLEPRDQPPGVENKDCQILLGYGSKKQPFAADSVAAAETIACYFGIRETLFAPRAFNHAGALRVFVDNSQVVSLARNGHSESLEFAHRAVNVRAACLKDAGRLGWTRVCKVPTRENRSNLMTKPVKASDLDRERRLLGLH